MLAYREAVVVMNSVNIDNGMTPINDNEVSELERGRDRQIDRQRVKEIEREREREGGGAKDTEKSDKTQNV